MKLNVDGFPIFDKTIDMGIPNGVNTLLYTIVKYFVGIPSSITNCISDLLNNLRYHQIFDYKCYQNVSMSHVIFRDDS